MLFLPISNNVSFSLSTSYSGGILGEADIIMVISKNLTDGLNISMTICIPAQHNYFKMMGEGEMGASGYIKKLNSHNSEKIQHIYFIVKH